MVLRVRGRVGYCQGFYFYTLNLEFIVYIYFYTVVKLLFLIREF